MAGGDPTANPNATLPVITPEMMAYDAGPGAIRAISAVIVVTTAFVALRIWMRLYRHVGMGLDDWLIIAAMLVLWAEFADGVLSITDGGIGRHLLVLLMENPNILSRTMLWMYIGELLFFTTLALIKWSVLAMYYRIFPTRFMKWGYIILGGMTLMWWIAVMLVTVFQCTPVHAMWDLATPEAHCINANVFYISTNGVPNIVTDVMILLLPMYEVYKLHVSRAQKIAIAGSFLVGWIVVISSIVKLKVMVDLYNLGPTADVTFHLPQLIIWVEVEPCMGIISATLPTLRPLLTMFLRKTGLSKDESKGSGPSARPSLITFGQGSNKKKGSQFTTIRSIDDNDTSQERLHETGLNNHPNEGAVPTWPSELRSSRSAVIKGGENQHLDGPYANNQTQEIPLQSIAVTTEMAWNESHPPQYGSGPPMPQHSQHYR
ncbi:hypothetical protein QBC35DRAFT_394291 [Podospora australis]|uniref:Rhodopsin domain-containing protein n=1 Tax=Podospora australis TaxID=1536484 RepID=A0AAN6WN65_9PEZI|nr:hypothetical protein QBC35DRAFT_394291 [Podospora australis]